MRNDTISELSAPIQYDGRDFEEQLEQAMDIFYNSFLEKAVKPKYNGKHIFFDMSKKYGSFSFSYPERFLHLVSLDDDEKFNVLQCANDNAYEHCDPLCEHDSNIPMFKVLGRWECPYRLSRIHRINEVFALANKGNPHISEWDDVDNRLIRYNYGIDDYLIVLRKRKRDYNFITAFPVLSRRKKNELTEGYLKYKSK